MPHSRITPTLHHSHTVAPSVDVGSNICLIILGRSRPIHVLIVSLDPPQIPVFFSCYSKEKSSVGWPNPFSFFRLVISAGDDQSVIILPDVEDRIVRWFIADFGDVGAVLRAGLDQVGRLNEA